MRDTSKLPRNDVQNGRKVQDMQKNEPSLPDLTDYDLSRYIACHECDLLIHLPERLDVYTQVCCPRCSAKQFTVRKSPIDKTLAYALTALVLLSIAVSFPFLRIEASGIENSISLVQSPLTLFNEGYGMIATIVMLCVIALPAAYLLCLLLLLIPLFRGKSARASLVYAKLIDGMLPWIMVDVFVIGVLVALIKLIETADIILGTAFWAYIAFAAVFIGINTIVSKRQLWFWVVNAGKANAN
uniref:paraquat-inducible protein A n=1 Tax=Ningiella ruwaisensis TaxID=2364274 RepID=UPI00109FDE8A|nr:paraquat-inducible protein A [Ningiella ruwaisensis]